MRVPQNFAFSNAFFHLFTLTRPSSRDLTTSWLSFRVQLNRKVFHLYEESFHHFKPFYFKVFRAPGTILFLENLEGELRINCFWSKHFEVPRVNENELTSWEAALVDYFLTAFGDEHLNLKCVVSVDSKAARTHLGCYQDIVLHIFILYAILTSIFSFLVQKKWLWSPPLLSSEVASLTKSQIRVKEARVPDLGVSGA